MSDPVSDIPSSTSTSLILRVKQRDEAAWKRLVELYSRLVLYWCRQADVPSQDRRDILQDVFRAAFASIDTFSKTKKGDSFRGWLRSVTRTRIADYFRNNAKLPTTTKQELLETLEARPETIEEQKENDLLTRQAWKMVLKRTDEKTRKIVELLMDGLNSTEVGERLGMKPGTVRAAKRRVKAMLKEFDGLIPQENEDGDSQDET